MCYHNKKKTWPSRYKIAPPPKKKIIIYNKKHEKCNQPYGQKNLNPGRKHSATWGVKIVNIAKKNR